MKRTIVTPAPPRSFQPWGAGAEAGRGQEAWRRPTEWERQNSQKDRGRGDKPRGEILRAPGPGRGVGGRGGRERVQGLLWPEESLILTGEHLVQLR